jgi:hypothetical protein
MNTNQSLGVSTTQAEAMTNEFYEQMEPKVKKGRAWTFHRLNAACDTPDGERVQAVLYPDDGQGFSLYARQGQTLHAVTHEGRPVRFRTIEKALTTLADVTHLDPEIVVDSSNWREEVGPH